ncbi:hypothetical protein [uncultured Eudoraea sp.]|uniref:hypothetical protein n=1 Tax=uncultured Eudoraea sp. TaxID=1035614 RepID=UPI00260BD5A6|nr:hypothetical protein [uncultured Eudoraea sp.]
MRILILGLLMLTGTCGSQKDKNNDTKYQASAENPLMLVLSDNYGGTETEQLMVIRDTKTLKSFFTKVNMTRKPGLSVPEIDFNKEMVVIYCNGKTTDINTPELNRVEDNDNKMVFSRVTDSNQKKDVSTAVLMPFHLYKMPLIEKEIILDSNK